jgi:hypothetical protein
MALASAASLLLHHRIWFIASLFVVRLSVAAALLVSIEPVWLLLHQPAPVLLHLPGCDLLFAVIRRRYFAFDLLNPLYLRVLPHLP